MAETKKPVMAGMDVMTTAEVACSLGVSVATLHNWKHSGKFVPAGVCARGFNVYSSSQVEQFKDTQAKQGKAMPEEIAMGAAAAASILGISVSRLRSLDRAGRFVPAGRSASNRRLYTELQVQEIREYLAAGNMPPKIASLTITRHDAAKILGVSLRTMHLWEKERKLVPLARWESQSLYTEKQVANYKKQWLAATAATQHISRPGTKRPGRKG